jgi:hypothetical protein
MPSSANDCNLVRVFPRLVGGLVAVPNVPDNVQFEVIVEGEVGQALFDTGGAVKIIVQINDLTDNAVAFSATLLGHFGVEWNTLAKQFVFLVPPQTAANDDHLYQAYAVGVAGTGNPDTSFVQSDLFIISEP